MAAIELYTPQGADMCLLSRGNNVKRCGKERYKNAFIIIIIIIIININIIIGNFHRLVV